MQGEGETYRRRDDANARNGGGRQRGQKWRRQQQQQRSLEETGTGNHEAQEQQTGTVGSRGREGSAGGSGRRQLTRRQKHARGRGGGSHGGAPCVSRPHLHPRCTSNAPAESSAACPLPRPTALILAPYSCWQEQPANNLSPQARFKVPRSRVFSTAVISSIIDRTACPCRLPWACPLPLCALAALSSPHLLHL